MTTITAPAFTITDARRQERHSYVSGESTGIYARVEFPSGASYELSRLAGESGWTVDASWGKGSFPHWCNGYGARYLLTKQVADASLIAALDAMAAAL